MRRGPAPRPAAPPGSPQATLDHRAAASGSADGIDSRHRAHHRSEAHPASLLRSEALEEGDEEGASAAAGDAAAAAVAEGRAGGKVQVGAEEEEEEEEAPAGGALVEAGRSRDDGAQAPAPVPEVNKCGTDFPCRPCLNEPGSVCTIDDQVPR